MISKSSGGSKLILKTFKIVRVYIPPSRPLFRLYPSLPPHSYAIYPIMCGHMKKSLKLSKFLTPTSSRGQDTSSVFNFLSMIKGSENGISFLLVVGDQLRHKTMHILFTQGPIRTKVNSNLIVENN